MEIAVIGWMHFASFLIELMQNVFETETRCTFSLNRDCRTRCLQAEVRFTAFQFKNGSKRNVEKNFSDRFKKST